MDTADGDDRGGEGLTLELGLAALVSLACRQQPELFAAFYETVAEAIMARIVVESNSALSKEELCLREAVAFASLDRIYLTAKEMRDAQR